MGKIAVKFKKMEYTGISSTSIISYSLILSVKVVTELMVEIDIRIAEMM
jgi:hypothetical protein